MNLSLCRERLSPLSPWGRGVGGEGRLSPLSPLGRGVGGEGLGRMPLTLPPCQTGLAFANAGVRRLKPILITTPRLHSASRLCQIATLSRASLISAAFDSSCFGERREQARRQQARSRPRICVVCCWGEHGVRPIFGYPGGQLTPIYDALALKLMICDYLASIEQAVGFMAEPCPPTPRAPCGVPVWPCAGRGSSTPLRRC